MSYLKRLVVAHQQLQRQYNSKAGVPGRSSRFMCAAPDLDHVYYTAPASGEMCITAFLIRQPGGIVPLKK